MNNSSTALTPGEVFFVTGEYTYFFGTILVMFFLFLCKCLRFKWILAYLIGFGFGLIWEVTHSLLGDNFLSLVNPNIYRYISRFVYPVLHAGADGTIFVGIFAIIVNCLVPLCVKRTRMLSVEDKLTFCPCSILALMISLYLMQEFFFELAFNSKVWFYSANVTWNPVAYKIGDIPYTIIPLAEWIVFGFLYWVSMFFVFNTSELSCTNCCCRKRIEPTLYQYTYFDV